MFHYFISSFFSKKEKQKREEIQIPSSLNQFAEKYYKTYSSIELINLKNPSTVGFVIENEKDHKIFHDTLREIDNYLIREIAFILKLFYKNNEGDLFKIKDLLKKFRKSNENDFLDFIKDEKEEIKKTIEAFYIFDSFQKGKQNGFRKSDSTNMEISMISFNKKQKENTMKKLLALLSLTLLIVSSAEAGVLFRTASSQTVFGKSTATSSNQTVLGKTTPVVVTPVATQTVLGKTSSPAAPVAAKTQTFLGRR